MNRRYIGYRNVVITEDELIIIKKMIEDYYFFTGGAYAYSLTVTPEELDNLKKSLPMLNSEIVWSEDDE